MLGAATRWILVMMLILGSASPGQAAMAAIETMTALEDESDEAVKNAVERAVKAAVRGAVAMGLPWVELRGARVLPGLVAVQIVARESEAAAPEDQLLQREGPSEPEGEPAPREGGR